MPDTFTPEQISQILEEFFKVVGTRQYIGARYVPIFGRKDEESIEWDNTAPYEPLTIVLYQGNSYTSRQFVPVGVEITNQEFWALTGNYNAQVEQYRRETAAAREVADNALIAANAAQTDIDTLLPKADFDAENTVKKYVDDSVAEVQADIDTLLPKADFSPESTVKDYVDTTASALMDKINEHVLVFDSVADMKASESATEGTVCLTLGYYSNGDGGGAYYTVSDSGTANNMDVIQLDNDLIASLVFDDMLNVRQIGASDAKSDNAPYFNRAIQLATSLVKNIFFPSGTYRIETDLIDIPSNIRLIGNNSENIFGVTTKILDYRTSENYLINYVRVSDPSAFVNNNGGGIDGIAFYGNSLDHGCINNSIKAVCWDGHFKNMVIANYNYSAMKIDTHDCYYENILFAACGSEDHYCIEINGGANMQKFYSCHWEVCRHIIHANQQNYLNSFIDCKFEMDPPVGTSLAAPIHIQGTNTSTVQCSFINCEFVGLSIQAYMDQYTDAGMSVTYLSVPFMVDYDNVLNAQVTGCKFITGRGAESTQTPYIHQTRFLRCYDGMVSNCFFADPAYYAAGIYVGEAVTSNLDIVVSNIITDFTSPAQQKYVLQANNKTASLNNIVFRGSIADNFYPCNIVSAGVKSMLSGKYTNVIVPTGTSTGYLTYVVKNFEPTITVTTWLKIALQYKGIMGIRGECMLHYYVTANNADQNGAFIKEAMVGGGSPYNQIDAYLVDGDLFIQIPARDTEIMFFVDGVRGYDAFGYYDKSITEAIATFDKHITLTL